MYLRYFRDTREPCQGCIEDDHEIFSDLFNLRTIIDLEGVVRVFKYAIGLIQDLLAQVFTFKIPVISVLVEIILKTISFKELIIVWEIVWHIIERLIKSICQAAPEAVAFTVVNGAIH